MPDERKAYAKINLALFITDKLPNGYHSLETIFAPINWFDTLWFSPSPTIELTCSNPSLPTDSTNLCVRAAQALRERCGVEKGIRIHLEKNIPFGAGLGGGSSDAATTLNYLNRHWGLNLSKDELARLALSLGADVPYFLAMSGLAFAEGVGEKLVDLRSTFPFPIVVAFPREEVSTAWAYKNLRLSFPRRAPDCREALKNLIETGDARFLSAFENDFEPLVESAFPVVKSLKRTFLEFGAIKAMMTGSGSAVFGVFGDEASAKRCCETLSRRFPASYTPPNFAITNADFVSF
ncbi:MAG: 4-(cytidine 5'-diphospho)-2-C-methyl-D-erythritol kinase [Chloroherpetonaceae bacterium]|nr:4-(cytidine 5'-diphospho)-2-C-methyl-D-erythritol kinase [Chloroherpetonaceae bacterium]MDW8436850.1 4-(cytidine 5'-diphospho)-2-C-methyl-D-erythritol kinase [Chloroherpetonaceae bacterium]